MQFYGNERTTPHSVESEKAILGSILLTPNILVDVEAELEPRHFFVHTHRLIYGAMLDLSRNGTAIDPIHIANRIDMDEIKVSSITNLYMGLPPGVDITGHIKTVKDKSTLRQLLLNTNAMTQLIYDYTGSVDNLVQEVEAKIFESTGDSFVNTDFSECGSLVLESIRHANKVQIGEETFMGTPTDLVDVDLKLMGLKKTDSVIVAARPSMGKTSFATTVAANAAIRHGAAIAIFSLEMSKKQLIDRMLCSEAEVDSTKYLSGALSEKDWDKIKAASHSLANAKIFINDTGAINVNFIKSSLRRLIKREGSVDLVIIDYLQLMTGVGRTNNRYEEVTQISRDLKALAKEFNVPVMVLSQLSRAPETRSDKRPVMADLRESGAIEQDADVILFIYREDAYNGDITSHNGLAELIIAKNRSGPTGTAVLEYAPKFTKFSNKNSIF